MTGLGERCSALSRSMGISPIGSAGHYDGFVLVEHPLPWGKDVADEPDLQPVFEALAHVEGRWRVQALVPTVANSTRTIVYRRPPGEPFVRYERAEGDRADLADLADLLTASGDDSSDADVLICTHGRRDVCCGTRGTELWKRLDERLHILGAGVQLWRTSHTGGHRFAPTAIVFPAGQLWAWLDADLLHRIVHRDGAVRDIAPHYRGCAAFQTPALQAAEREAFVAEGWDWLDYPRWGREENGVAVIEFERPDGEGRRGRYDVTVEVERMAPVPVCGEPIEAATKSEPDLRVVNVEAS